VLLGQQDYLSRNSSRRMAETIPGAALRRIAGAGHITPLEEPRQFNAIVHDFLRA
jgi:pimeloyl-ACP methyl ester carboxylesterase